MDIEIFKGSIDLLILSTLSNRTSYGYEISKLIKEKSNGTYKVGEGTLYSSLKRLEQKNLIKSFWQFTEERNRKYYDITPLGIDYLNDKVIGLKNFNNLLDDLLGGQINGV